MRFYCLLLLAVLMAACEGDFAGNRPFEMGSLSGPYRLHRFQIEGGDYLGVLNTNYRGVLNAGSIHFYDLANPQEPSLNETLSLKVPSNAGDFYYHAASRKLFVLDRNQSKLLIYELSGGSFIEHSDSGVDLFANPVAMVFFGRGDEEDPYLAISSLSGGTLQFFDITESRLMDEDDISALLPNVEGKKEIFYTGRQNLVGARFEMKAREAAITPFAIEDSVSGISGSARLGRGIGDLVHLSGEHNIFVVASIVDTALFGFRLDIFDNISNLLWNLSAYEKGREENNVEFPGTKSSGFRGIAKDGDENIYLSSRADNSLYVVPGDLFRESREVVDEEADRSKDLNTTVFRKNKRPYRLQVDFDEDPSDEEFPRLSALVVNNQEAGAASRAYVLGLEGGRRGMERSHLYAVNLHTSVILKTYTFPDGSRPQQLYLSEADDILYVSYAAEDHLAIFDVSGDDIQLIRTIGEAEGS